MVGVSVAFTALALLLALGIPLLLWVLVSAETDNTQVMDRQSAERTARADSRTPDEQETRRDDDTRRF